MRGIKLLLLFCGWLAGFALAIRYFGVSISVDPLMFIYAVLVLFVIRALCAWNWAALAKASGVKVDYPVFLRGAFIAGFMDSITPPLMPSAELAASCYFKGRVGGNVKDYFPLVFLESTSVFLSQALMFIAMGLWLGGSLTEATVFVTFALAVFVAVTSALWIFRRNVVSDVLRLSMGQLEDINDVMDSIISLASENWLLVVRVVVVAMVSLLLEVSVVFFLVGEMDAFLVVTMAFLGSRLISLFSMIPGGLGVYEVSMGAMLSLGGLTLPTLLGAILVYRTVFFWLNIFIGGYFTGSEVYNWVGELKKQGSRIRI